MQRKHPVPGQFPGHANLLIGILISVTGEKYISKGTGSKNGEHLTATITNTNKMQGQFVNYPCIKPGTCIPLNQQTCNYLLRPCQGKAALAMDLKRQDLFKAAMRAQALQPENLCSFGKISEIGPSSQNLRKILVNDFSLLSY